MMVFGAGQLAECRVDVFPEFAPPRVEIQTIMPRALRRGDRGARHRPARAALNGVPGLDMIRSKSVPQLSSIELIFKPGTDLLRARQLVQERLADGHADAADLGGAAGHMPPLSATSRVMKIGMSSNDDVAASSCRRSPTGRSGRGCCACPAWRTWRSGASACSRSTSTSTPTRMQAHDVSLDRSWTPPRTRWTPGCCGYSDGGDVIGTGGFVDTPNQRLGDPATCCRSSRRATWPRSPSSSSDGKRVRLGDVADVDDGPSRSIGDAVINDGPGLLLVVEKSPGREHARGHARASRGARRTCSPACPASSRRARSSGQANFIEHGDRQPHAARCCSAACSWCWC